MNTIRASIKTQTRYKVEEILKEHPEDTDWMIWDSKYKHAIAHLNSLHEAECLTVTLNKRAIANEKLDNIVEAMACDVLRCCARLDDASCRKNKKHIKWAMQDLHRAIHKQSAITSVMDILRG